MHTSTRFTACSLGYPWLSTITEFEDGILRYKTHEYEGNFLKSVNEIESNGDSVITQYQYAKSSVFDGAPVFGSDLLRGAHNYNAKIRTLQTVNGALVYKLENKYETPLETLSPFSPRL